MASAGVKPKLQTPTYEQKFEIMKFAEAKLEQNQLQWNSILDPKLSDSLKNWILSDLRIFYKSDEIPRTI